jgi:hypothetical protein
MEDDKRKGDAMVAPNHRLKTFLSGQTDDRADQPIADFFPHCTGMLICTKHLFLDMVRKSQLLIPILLCASSPVC